MTHDVMDAMVQAMVAVMAALIMQRTSVASASVLLTSPDLTAHSTKQIVMTNVTDVMIRPILTTTLTPTTTVSTV